MLRRFVVLLIAGLWLIACQAPLPAPPPASPPSPLSSATPTVVTAPTAAPTSDAPVSTGAWQVWQAATYPQGVFDVVFGDDTLWAATSFGIARIDLVTHAYTTDETPGRVYRILPIENGRAIAVSDLGMLFFDGQAWSRFTVSPTYGLLYPPSVYALGIDDTGDLWLFSGVSRGVLTIHLPGHEPPRAGPWLAVTPVSGVYHDSRSCTGWLAYSEYNFAYRTPDECQNLMTALKVFEQRAQFGPLAVDVDQSVWWLNADRLQHLNAAGSLISQLPIPPGSRLVADPRGGVWAATTEGLFYATAGNLQHTPIGLEKRTLYTPRAIAVDANGVVWAATERGLQLLSADGQRWSIEPDTHLGGVLNNSSAIGLVAAREGGLWLTHGFDLLRYDGVTVTSLASLPADSGCGLGPLQVDQSGDLWSIGYRCGVWQYHVATNEWQGHQVNQYIDQLAVGTDGTVLALTGDGQLLAHAPGGEWTTLASIDRSGDVIAITDQRGGAWVGSRYTGELWHYRPDGRNPIDKVVDANTYFNLLSDPSGQFWLSKQAELLRFDGTRWQPMLASEIGLINALTAAPDGRLWFASERGIAVYDPAHDAVR
ncbi:MAG: hypothetical protein HY870_21250 [Chloroflexi bacterium]|nr:hypothetical protein [Chloroflexota bacterium]